MMCWHICDTVSVVDSVELAGKTPVDSVEVFEKIPVPDSAAKDPFLRNIAVPEFRGGVMVDDEDERKGRLIKE